MRDDLVYVMHIQDSLREVGVRERQDPILAAILRADVPCIHFTKMQPSWACFSPRAISTSGVAFVSRAWKRSIRACADWE